MLAEKNRSVKRFLSINFKKKFLIFFSQAKYSMAKFIDLNPSFVAHPKTGDLTRLFDDVDIKNSIKSLVLTNHYEVPFRPWEGGNILDLLFEPATPITTRRIEERITDLINTYEPRVILLNMIINFIDSNNSYNVKIDFEIVGSSLPMSMSIILQRER